MFFLKNKLRVSKGINTILIIGNILDKTSSHLLSAANPLLLRSARVLVSLVYLQPNHGNTPLNDAFEKVTLFLNRHWYTLSLFLAYYHLNFFSFFFFARLWTVSLAGSLIISDLILKKFLFTLFSKIDTPWFCIPKYADVFNFLSPNKSLHWREPLTFLFNLIPLLQSFLRN